MAEPIKTVQNQPSPDPVTGGVSVPQGGPEGSPIGVTPQEQAGLDEALEQVKAEIQNGPMSERPPELSPEVGEAGVIGHGAEERHPDIGQAKSPELAPTEPVYKISTDVNPTQIKHNLEQPPETSTPWRTLILVFNKKRQELLDKLFNRQPLQQKPV